MHMESAGPGPMHEFCNIRGKMQIYYISAQTDIS